MKGIMKFLSVLVLFLALNISVAKATDLFWDKQPPQSMSIYPNPAVNVINIEYKATSNYHIVISNILGTAVYKSPTIDRFTENNVFQLADLDVHSGIYLVKVYEGSVLKATKKLIVRST